MVTPQPGFVSLTLLAAIGFPAFVSAAPKYSIDQAMEISRLSGRPILAVAGQET